MIAVDMDGCVTDFVKGFTLALTRYLPEAPVISHRDAQDWDLKGDWYWPEFTERKVLAVAQEALWENINRSNYFWKKLPPLWPASDLSVLAENARSLVFMTRREGDDAWGQTVTWLRTYGIPEPLVVRVHAGEEKHILCDTMGIRVLIDDAPKYVVPAAAAGIHVVMPDHPYNRGVNHHRVTRVEDLKTALEEAFYLDRLFRGGGWSDPSVWRKRYQGEPAVRLG